MAFAAPVASVPAVPVVTAPAVLDTLINVVARVPDPFWIALGILALGLIAGYVVGVVNRGILQRAGIPETLEATTVERTLQGFGTSTVSVVAKLSMYFIWGLAAVIALTVAFPQYEGLMWALTTAFLPQLFIAVLVLVVGIVVGDKAELAVGERLRGLKVPQVGLLARLTKYTIFYIAVLVALGQLGIATAALLVMLFIYFFALVVLGGLAFKDLLSSSAAGLYLLLNEPYSIGDRIRVGDRRGIVQEMDVFVTTVETENGTEYIIPNHLVFQEGVVRLRE